MLTEKLQCVLQASLSLFILDAYSQHEASNLLASQFQWYDLDLMAKYRGMGLILKCSY